MNNIIKTAVDKINLKSISRAAKIRKWKVLPRDLSALTDDITPSLKLKKSKIEKHFIKEINEIYNLPKL